MLDLLADEIYSGNIKGIYNDKYPGIALFWYVIKTTYTSTEHINILISTVLNHIVVLDKFSMVMVGDNVLIRKAFACLILKRKELEVRFGSLESFKIEKCIRLSKLVQWASKWE